MPSIEIICEDQESPVEFYDLPFAVEADKELISHRYPSRFQAQFDKMKGCIYHLGNPEKKEPQSSGFYFASELLDEEFMHGDEGALKFSEQYRNSVQSFMQRLIDLSPKHRLVFTCDYQFGPEMTIAGAEILLTEFWEKHDQNQLQMNSIYRLIGSIYS